MSFAQWWNETGRKLVYEDLSHFEVARRAWLVSQTVQIKTESSK